MSISKNLTIRSSVGLHARPAAEFVKIAQEFNGEVTISYNDQEVDGKSMIGILKLGIKKDQVIDFEFSRTKIDQVYTKVILKYNYNYGREDFESKVVKEV